MLPRTGPLAGRHHPKSAILVALFGALGASTSVLAEDEARVAEAFNWTVVFLMAMPYAIGGAVLGWICYNYWRANKRRRVSDDKASLHLIKKEKPR